MTITTIELPLPCIVCGMRPESAIPADLADNDHNQPYGATAFTTRGHYGSTVFDPGKFGVFLEINVCDECLLKKAADGVIARATELRRFDYSYERWDPNEEGDPGVV